MVHLINRNTHMYTSDACRFFSFFFIMFLTLRTLQVTICQQNLSVILSGKCFHPEQTLVFELSLIPHLSAMNGVHFL